MPGDPPVTLEALKRYALDRSLFRPTTLSSALERLGFLQADPIRAPARAQDLILRHRVRGYRAGDLERRYASLPVEEDFFVNYGFVSRTLQSLLHPRSRGITRAATHRRRSAAVLAFVRMRGTVHPRDVDAHFSHGSVTNYWGGSSSATTHLLDDLHYQGALRVAGRANGIRLYALRDGCGAGVAACRSRADARAARDAALDALIDAAVSLYAPVPSATLAWLVNRLRLATPQWRAHLRPALARAKARLAHAPVDGIEWYWPHGDQLQASRHTTSPPGVRLLAPFDPVVWDRKRFERFWGWAYRFEAYTPPAKRKLGYYALPLLWGTDVIGWANLSVQSGVLRHSVGFVGRPPAARTAFRDALDAEIARIRTFLGTTPDGTPDGAAD